jgi:catechol 2,3-dioxygenase-like lactoylglutathione lyase family enzyme
VLKDSDVSTRLPAQDLARARAFYAEKLGLEPVEERPAWFRDSEEKLLGIGQAVLERQGR